MSFASVLGDGCDMVLANGHLAEEKLFGPKKCGQLQVILVALAVGGHHAEVLGAAEGEKLAIGVDDG